MKKKIALVTGGYSGEAEISYKSVITVENNVDREKFDVYKIDITPNGWLYLPEEGTPSAVNREDFTILDSGRKIIFDAVLMCIHGTPGEDGKLQGYFDLLHIPYTNCNAATSALTFNKRYTVAVAGFAGIAVAKSVLFFKHNYINAESAKNLQYPVFVKPNNGGSSIGMSKVNTYEDIEAAMQKAFKEDNEVLVEEFIKGRELTIGVYKSKGEIITLPMTEITTNNEFFDFEAKYQGKSEEVTPAKVDESIAEKVRAAAKQIYAELNCKGVVRIDFIYNEEQQRPFMLEINTVPGQSAASLIPQQVQAAGGNLKSFYTQLIEEALIK